MCRRNTQQQAQMCLQSLWEKSAINAREKIEIESLLASNAIKEPSVTLVYRLGVLSFYFYSVYIRIL